MLNSKVREMLRDSLEAVLECELAETGRLVPGSHYAEVEDVDAQGKAKIWLVQYVVKPGDRIKHVVARFNKWLKRMGKINWGRKEREYPPFQSPLNK